jgi:hypothetical protein
VSASAMQRPLFLDGRVDERPRPGEGQKADPAWYPALEADAVPNTPPPCGMLQRVCSGLSPQKRITPRSPLSSRNHLSSA